MVNSTEVKVDQDNCCTMNKLTAVLMKSFSATEYVESNLLAVEIDLGHRTLH
ncbi:hypothetical protein T06_1281 [Trichinella sp. T6]|nr:hypothetical protein T06_1281 [Trichinella sp. T6]